MATFTRKPPEYHFVKHDGSVSDLQADFNALPGRPSLTFAETIDPGTAVLINLVGQVTYVYEDQWVGFGLNLPDQDPAGAALIVASDQDLLDGYSEVV
jgi:hypothetical protein